RQAQSSTEAHSKSGPDPSNMLRVMVRYSNHEALEGQAHHPEQSRRTDGVSKGEKRQLTPHRSSLGPNTGIQTPCSI
ncbi:MAG: hypothetical protein V3U06_04300, partial [Candidatus Binatia bacterium]